MKHLAVIAMGILVSLAASAVEIGSTAPDFAARDLAGTLRTLAEFKGKTVVLEWNNPGCPYVQKHYTSGNIPSLQKAYTDKGVIWLTVNSTSRNSPDYMGAPEQGKWNASMHAAPTAYLEDPSGTIGRLYAAKTTPHMFVIDTHGKLAYAGGIDDIRSTDVADIARARNFVRDALDELIAGKPVSTPVSRAYGCSVKY